MTEQQFQLRYLIMPDYIYSDKRLTDVSRRVYAFIHTYKNPFYFGNENLAKMFNCHEQTISTAMGQLEELGLILVEYTPKAGGGKTRLCVDAHSERVSTLSRPKKTKATNESLHSDKEGKENKQRVKIGEEEFEVDAKGKMLNPETGIPFTASQLKAMRQKNGWGSVGGRNFQQYPPKRNDYQEAPKKGVAMGEDIP